MSVITNRPDEPWTIKPSAKNNYRFSPKILSSILKNEAFYFFFAGAALAQEVDSLNTVDDSFSYYYDEFGVALGNATEENRGKNSLIRDDPGSCLICDVQDGYDYNSALKECKRKGKFVQCNNESGQTYKIINFFPNNAIELTPGMILYHVYPNNDAGATPNWNLCELTERRNNGKIQLTSTCNQQSACLGNQKQNDHQCLPFGAVDRNGIEKASTCRQCFGVGRQVNSFLKNLISGKYDFSDYDRDFTGYY
ncbi:Oidioi.mRNA.OKI2018_I69.PAR.g8498.t1.cds [Oikopleura dioica]|uniref:Oidioi.mRNA.OKI2018_I69.PAR.g8498.t1.cds n=1 Tax=Oikopleura dioica TaxID=34765 RepID=A0ABN7RG74_OIKDI|nr:Oidioi.mRNA.OKI2018_I69.PAR.g8498.t1.cds [Oikopleura dioica]